MLDKAVASRVVSSTTAKGSGVAEGPDGRKKRGVKTTQISPGGEQPPTPVISPARFVQTHLKPPANWPHLGH